MAKRASGKKPASANKDGGGLMSRLGFGGGDPLVEEDRAPEENAPKEDSFGFAHEGHWLTQPDTIRILWIGFGLCLVLLVLSDIAFHHHKYFGVDGTFGFYAWYGLFTSAGLVFLAKILGIFLKRPDDYYDE